MNDGRGDRHPDIPWKTMAGMRGKLIHDYDRVDAKRVWEVVTTSLPDLLNQLQPLLPKEGEF